MATRVSLYGNGLFNDPPPPGLPYAKQIVQLLEAKFTTALLWSIHVHPNGDLYYNDTPLVQNQQFKLSAEFITNVKTLHGGGVKELLISIGAWGTATDFTNLDASWNSGGSANLQTLFSTLPITAVDFDYEGDYGPDAQNLIVDLTKKIAGLKVGVTYCPYTATSFWTGCLQKVYSDMNSQPVRYMNLQCYAGGAGNDPRSWVSAVKSAGAGITNPGAFIVPGYWVANGGEGNTCPTALQSTLASLAGSGIDGAFLWNSGDMFANESPNSPLCSNNSTMPDAYANAIRTGLSATTASV